MRVKFKGVFIFLLILIGALWTVAVVGLHLKYKRGMESLIENRVIYNITDSKGSDDIEDSSDTDALESDMNDLTIEVVTEDQKIGSISKGTPIIQIPSLDITVPVIDGTDSHSLRLGAGKFDHAVNMGEKGNFAVAGHSSTIYNCIFNNLESIKLADKIECYDSKGVQYNYYVTNTFVTDPSDIGVTYSSDKATMTIVTCTDKGKSRFIVSAELMTDKQYKEYKDNLKGILISKAKDIASDYLDVDILSYLSDSGYHAGRVPYNFNYTNIEDVDTFFENYIAPDGIKIKNSNKVGVSDIHSFGLSK